MKLSKKMFTGAVAFMLCMTGIIATETPGFAKSKDTIEITLATYVSSNYHISENVTKWWCDEIEKRTDGRVETKVYYGGSLYGADEQVEAIANGLADIDPLFVSSYSPGILPMLRLVACPFLFQDSHIGARVGEELFHKYTKKQFEKAGIKLGWFGPTALYLYIGNKKVTALEDFQGLNIRTSGGVKAKVMEEQYGVTATRIPSSEIYMALQRGMVDGALKGFSGINSHKLYEVADHITTFNGTGFAAVMCGSIMNPDFYESLPSDIQKIIYELNREASYKFVKSYAGGKDKHIKEIKSQGVEFTDITGEELEEMKEAAAPVIEREIKKLEEEGYPARQYYEDFKDLSKKYNDMTIEEYGRMQKEDPVSKEKLGY